MRIRVAGLALGMLFAPLVAEREAVGNSTGTPTPVRVLPADKLPEDGRLNPPRTLNDDHPFTPPTSLDAWHRRHHDLRVQLLVANGLWPVPARTPLEPVVHGRIDKGDYTIERVYFQSYPGHYVTGNLYRPKDQCCRHPGILNPHGHWKDGRFYDAGEAEAGKQIEQKAEKFPTNARYPLQARMASLARMGCVVFHYDMVGYADSKPIGHREGFTDADAILRLQSFMGLQTWNSVRALDFLCSLPDVDPCRVGITGASGGGTQSMLLAALDDRLRVAFPAVMVSTGMQGGCICENCPLLRVGTGNIEFAGLFAPKPYAMSGADDWTIEIETKGFPELAKLYTMYGVPDRISAKAFPQFKHNYNQVAREMMYDWMNRYLCLGLESVEEKAIEPVVPAELSVWNEQHPLPSNAKSARALRDYLTSVEEDRLRSLWPTSPRTLAGFRSVVLPALKAMVVDALPEPTDVIVKEKETTTLENAKVHRLTLARRELSPFFPPEQIPAVAVIPDGWNHRMVVWTAPAGHAGLFGSDGKPGASLSKLLSHKTAVLAVDVFLTGEFHPPGGTTPGPKINEQYAGFNHGYNRTVLANQVHDVLTAITAARGHFDARQVDLVGTGDAGVWTILAKAIAGPAVQQTFADLNQFSFASIERADDPRLVPGAVKYGDLPAILTLCAPDSVAVTNVASGLAAGVEQARRAYSVACRPDALVNVDPSTDPADWLLGTTPSRGVANGR